jgi:hypothetical protein
MSMLAYKSMIGTFLIGTILFYAAPTLPLAEAPLLQLKDFKYLGAFKAPSGQFGSSSDATFAYSDDGLAYNSNNNSLFIKNFAQQVAEISIPEIVNSSKINDLKTASVLQKFSDITEGHLNPENIANGMKLGGLLVYKTKLIGSEWAYYDGAAQQTKSHFYSGLTLSTSGDYYGMYTVGTVFPAFVGGYMTAIPSDYQSLLGGTALTGHCCTSIIGHQSLGPSAWVFDPDDLDTKKPVPASPMVYYNLSHPTLGKWEHPLPANPVYNVSTLITGLVFPPGTRSIIFVGSTGMGPQCYGEGTRNQSLDNQPVPDSPKVHYCYDPADSSKGTHAYPYSPYLWFYDVNDFIAVKNQIKKPWDIVPYSSSALTLPISSRFGRINGAAYDPSTKRLYIAQHCVDANCMPLIHVFQLSLQPAAPKDPGAIP